MRTLILTLSLTLGLPTLAQAAETTWAVFDSQRAMEATKHFKDAKAALEKEVTARKSEIEAEQMELKADLMRLEAQKAVSPEGSQAEREAQLRQRGLKLQQKAIQNQRELQAYDQKLKGQLFRRLEVAVKIVANEGDYTFVVEASKVLYRRPKIDITDRVVEVYRERFGKKPLDLDMVSLAQPGQGS